MTRPLSPFALGFSVLAGPLVWFAHFMLVYMLAEFGCRANFNNVFYFDPNGMRVFTLVTTLIAILPVALGGLWALRQTRNLNTRREDDTEHEARIRFLLSLGMGFSVVFVLSIVATAVPALFVAVCGRAL
jgi:heme/copper-type cytochrome/quinol oxidase subunit 4